MADESDSIDNAGVDPGALPVVVSPIWTRATPDDMRRVDFGSKIATSKSAEAFELSGSFEAAARLEANVETPEFRVYSMLSSACGMYFSADNLEKPFGPMADFGNRRSADISDFSGGATDSLAVAAEAATHPVLKARLCDVVWLLDRKRGKFAAEAIAAYVAIVQEVDRGDLILSFDEDASCALDHRACEYLRRALQLGRRTGWEKPAVQSAKTVAIALLERASKAVSVHATLWYARLNLDFHLSDPPLVASLVESVATDPSVHDFQSRVELWRIASRAFLSAKDTENQFRTQSEAAECLVAQAASVSGSAMLASHFLSTAIAQYSGVPGKKERRAELRHKLIDVQSGVHEEMGEFSHETDIRELVEKTETLFDNLSLRDQLFYLAASLSSPKPAELEKSAKAAIQRHPLSSLFAVSHMDSEGKVIHRSRGGGAMVAPDDDSIMRQINQTESIRRGLSVRSIFEPARELILSQNFLSEDALLSLMNLSPFVPPDLGATFARGFARLFQGDFVSATYILIPLLENSLRYVLKGHGVDVTIFDDATETQQDRTISSLFDQLRSQLDKILSVRLTAEMERLFLLKPGPYLRHRVAHGLLHDGDPYSADAIYACWFIFHLCLQPLLPRRTDIQIPQ
jgi:hypothetical protein